MSAYFDFLPMRAIMWSAGVLRSRLNWGLLMAPPVRVLPEATLAAFLALYPTFEPRCFWNTLAWIDAAWDALVACMYDICAPRFGDWSFAMSYEVDDSCLCGPGPTMVIF